MDPIVSTATETALQCGGAVVTRHVGYLSHYSDKLKDMKQNVLKLEHARNSVEIRVSEATRNGEKILPEVQHWLEQVDEKIKKYGDFLGDGDHEKTRCSIGFFPYNLQLRYRLGRQAAKLAEESKAEELWNEKFDRVSYRTPPSMDNAFSNLGYESFESRNETVGKIMQALEDSTVSMIGLYGVGGVGKTTLANEVAKKARENKMFNIVIMVSITENPDIKKVQGQIAEQLGMRLEEESEIVRADRLQKGLKIEKNTLIILDDLWDRLDLNRLGIPSSLDDADSKMEKGKLSADYNNSKIEKLSGDSNKMKAENLIGYGKGYKILLTSRSKEVLCDKMDVKEKSAFLVGVLNQKEAEDLLKRVAGLDGKDDVLDRKANEIAKMCGGLPIALYSIGRTLKKKSHFVWEDVCRQIERQTFTGDQEESIKFSVKLSYDHLKNDQLKYIFLQCARMGNDPLIMDLVKFCIGLGLLQGVYTIREARSRVNVLIGELKEWGLLLESYSNDRFHMHDIMRDVALSISSKEKHVYFMKNGILDEWPHKDKLGSYTAIYLHSCDIHDEIPPESIYCPRLEVLHIDSKDDFLEIPDNFFEGMVELRVLILTGFNLSCLPSSIKCLKRLRMLCLERCTLEKNLSFIGELKKLRILSFSGSNFESLPVELGQLGKLQLFDLSNCSKLKVVPSNIISKMYGLEEFYMRDTLISWEDEQGIQSKNASLLELRNLNQLRALEIHIPSVTHFPQNLFFDKLNSYKIVIGEFNFLSAGAFKMPDKYEELKFLALHLKEEGMDIHSQKWVKMLFKRVQSLLLAELNGVHDVFYELNVEGFPDLKHLSIVNNFGIQYIINSMEQLHPLQVFPKLESMSLYKMDNLVKICDSQLTGASFSKLKVIKIKACGKLGNLFTFAMHRLLTVLETVDVCDCDSLKEIVSVKEDVKEDVMIEFPQLQFLTLQSLPSFICLYSISRDQGCSLFNEKVSIPKLEWLELSSIYHIQKIWSDQCLDCFKNLLTLSVKDCVDLKYLLSFSMAGNLVNLQSLSISGCGMMENIFRIDDATPIDIFRKLKKMEIISMENLKTIWHSHIGLDSFHSLDSLIVRDCDKLVTVFPSYVGQIFQRIKSLEVAFSKSVESIFDLPQTNGKDETNMHSLILRWLPNLVQVWKGDTRVLKYNNLQNINIDFCLRLEYLFPLYVASGLEKLEFLEVQHCRGMKEIVAWDKGSNEQSITFKFPHLNTLSFTYLNHLKNFYPGIHTLEWSSLKKLKIFDCNNLEALSTKTPNSQMKPIFSATYKVLYNLELMGMSLKEANKLHNYTVSVQSMHKLKSLVLTSLNNTKNLFWFLHRLPNLESLTLEYCRFKKIWGPASLVAHEKIGVVVQLKQLILVNMWQLDEIGFEHDPLLQRIEHLLIFGCSEMTSLAPSSVSFCYLTHLEVSRCTRLKYLITSSTARSLVQLTTMKVDSCEMVVEIVAENENEDGKEIEFKQLKALELASLKNLTSFCSSKKCDFKFPLLENLVVNHCPQMTDFAKVQSAPRLQKVHVVAEEKDRWYWEGDLKSTIHKVSFEYSEFMTLESYPEMKQVPHGKPVFPDNFFRNLKSLTVGNIFKHDIVIPSHVLPYLKSLEELGVYNCDAVKVIFDIDDTETEKTKETVFRLKTLSLYNLPNLKCVWNKNPQGIVSFPNIQRVSACDCSILTMFFPLCIARNLTKLNTLDIERCDMLVEVVGKEDSMKLESTEGSVLFEFPWLSRLVLLHLPQLSCFYPGRHRLECPILEELRVLYCGKFKLFTSKLHSHQEALTEGHVNSNASSSPLQEPLFLIEKVVPKLKTLALNEKNMILLNDSNLPLSLLRTLSLCYEEENAMATLPFAFLHKAPNLDFLTVGNFTCLKEIFPSQKLQVHDGILVGLKQLNLEELPELNLIGFEHPWVKPYSEKLEELSVSKCSSLKKLVHNAVSFINLKWLVVENCKSIESLFTFSTARSLVQLERLAVHECESLQEIVTKENEDVSDQELIFGGLLLLQLISLPSLVCYYSGSTTLQFSSLEKAIILECPNMKTFSGGVIDAPMLLGVRTSDQAYSDYHFHHDLNTTIRNINK